MKPYYEQDGITIYHGDCREILSPPQAKFLVPADVLVTDPPYGINYESGREGSGDRSVGGDDTTGLRDFIFQWRGGRPAAIFASWRCVPPELPRCQLVWAKNAGGMGDLSLPWKPNYEVCWIFGDGWHGHRGSSILYAETVPTWNTGAASRIHPTQKPVGLMTQILGKAPRGIFLDPFMGSGPTLVAAKKLGRQAIGIEIEERYCEIAAERLAQGVLDFSAAASDRT